MARALRASEDKPRPVAPLPVVGAPPDDKMAPTARAMLDVAERLFASRGIASVSFRDIVAASGQRNVSAVSYHFGSREALLAAMLSRRLWLLNKLRLQRLQLLIRLGKAGDPHALIGESLRVLADAVHDEPWGADCVAVLAQVEFSPELDLQRMVDPELRSGLQLAQELLRQALPALPPAVLEARMALGYSQGIHALAAWLQQHGRVEAGNSKAYWSYVGTLVDFLVGGVTAPITAQPER